MKHLIEKSNLTINSINYTYQRNVKGDIDWQWRMNGIVGARGVGKTTLMLQKLKQLQKEEHDVLYVRLDDFYFTENRVYDLAEEYRKMDGEYLYLDEVHKYHDWARELKNIYDSIPGIKVVFSGSSIIELSKQETDLSRRALMYEMTGLSFREYLQMAGLSDLSVFTFDEIIKSHTEISTVVISKLPVLKHFKAYLKNGFYPYFLEPHRDYLTTLQQVIRTIIESDLRFIENFDVAKSQKMLTLLRILASSSPFKPNISKISDKTGLHRHTVLQYFQYLEKARLIALLNHPDKYISRLQKPDKVFLDNPNLFYALNPEMINTGSLRETFALNQLSANHQVFLHPKADFIVDNKYTIEIGGRNKDFNQIAGLKDAFLFVDDIEIGHKNLIPLWLLGFLY